MDSATAGGSVTRTDITMCPTIVPQNFLAKLRGSSTEYEGENVVQLIEHAHAKINKDRRLTDQQKEDIRNLIKFSPNPGRTADRIGCTSKLDVAHSRWSLGFQYFIDSGSGKGERQSEVSTLFTAFDDQPKLKPCRSLLWPQPHQHRLRTPFNRHRLAAVHKPTTGLQASQHLRTQHRMEHLSHQGLSLMKTPSHQRQRRLLAPKYWQLLESAWRASRLLG
jgi:hypothetical protein